MEFESLVVAGNRVFHNQEVITWGIFLNGEFKMIVSDLFGFEFQRCAYDIVEFEFYLSILMKIFLTAGFG